MSTPLRPRSSQRGRVSPSVLPVLSSEFLEQLRGLKIRDPMGKPLPSGMLPAGATLARWITGIPLGKALPRSGLTPSNECVLPTTCVYADNRDPSGRLC